MDPGRLGLGASAAVDPAIMGVMEIVAKPGPPSGGFWKSSRSLEMCGSGWGLFMEQANGAKQTWGVCVSWAYATHLHFYVGHESSDIQFFCQPNPGKMQHFHSLVRGEFLDLLLIT